MYGCKRMHTGVWWENLKERDHLEDKGVDVRKQIKIKFYDHGSKFISDCTEFSNPMMPHADLQNILMNGLVCHMPISVCLLDSYLSVHSKPEKLRPSENMFVIQTCLMKINCNQEVKILCSSDVWLTVHRNSVWIRKTNQMSFVYSLFLFYQLLNMFRATMSPSSGADDCVMLQPCVGMCRGCRKVVKSGWQVVRPQMSLYHNSSTNPSMDVLPANQS